MTLSLQNITPENPLILMGCGKMGGAMLKGWLKGGLSSTSVKVVDPYRQAALSLVPALGESCFYEKLADLPEKTQPSFIILAVKPQMMDQVMEGLSDLDYKTTVFLSIAAGKTLSYFARHLGEETAIVRAMPNTPAAIGKGISAYYANKYVSESQRETCHKLLSSVGAVARVEEEGHIDAVTAVSGSGPAYVFHLVEAMAAAGEAIGLPLDLAQKLASQTVIGSGALLEQSDEDARQLRLNVTSPKGTTEAALNVLMDEDGMGRVMRRAIRAALERSRELAD